MRKLVLVVHTSLDGYVAGINGELTGFAPGTENLEFVCKLTRDADAALFGRISYELLDRYWPTARNNDNATSGEIDYSNWYNSAQKIVVSRTLPPTSKANTIIIDNNIAEKINEIKNQDGKDILLFGSPSVAQLLMQAGSIDSYWVFVNPAVFGNGIPLFKQLPDQIKLTLTENHLFPNGEMALHYIVKK